MKWVKDWRPGFLIDSGIELVWQNVKNGVKYFIVRQKAQGGRR
jgi:hypothetical protein